MREVPVRQLDDADLEVVHILRELGMDRRVATVLVFLSNVEEVGTREIEVGTGLRQPEVSLAMGFLGNRGWVDDRDFRPGGKGRPHKIYRLTTGLPDVISHLEAKKMKELAKVEESLEELKKLRPWVRRRYQGGQHGQHIPTDG